MTTRTVKEQAILDNIIVCMNCKNLDQKDLCKYLGVNPQMFTNWKNGHSNSYMRRLPKIAEFFDITVDYLIGKTDKKEKPTTETDDGLSPEFKSLYRQLTPEQKAIVLGAMREFVKEK